MNGNKYNDDLIEELDTLLDCMKEIVVKFNIDISENLKKHKKVAIIKEFLPAYIVYENKIYSIFEQYLSDIGNEYIERFNILWSDFQDTWEKDIWDEYYNLREIEVEEKENSIIKINNTFDNENKEIEKTETLENIPWGIDEELKKLPDYVNLEKNNKGGCFCFIF